MDNYEETELGKVTDALEITITGVSAPARKGFFKALALLLLTYPLHCLRVSLAK